MSQIGISFTPSGGSELSFIFNNFGGDELPRTYQSTASFSLSANGTSIIDGPAFRQKYQWVISSVVEKTDAEQFDLLFQAWDADRSQGLPAACGVIDQTFGPEVSANAVFVTPPSYVRYGPRFMLVSFGLEEV